jgi:hypothetical protein
MQNVTGARDFSFLQNLQTSSGANLAFYWAGYRRSFPREKRPAREVDLSARSGTKVKNAWSYTFSHPMSSWLGHGKPCTLTLNAALDMV